MWIAICRQLKREKYVAVFRLLTAHDIKYISMGVISTQRQVSFRSDDVFSRDVRDRAAACFDHPSTSADERMSTSINTPTFVTPNSSQFSAAVAQLRNSVVDQFFVRRKDMENVLTLTTSVDTLNSSDAAFLLSCFGRQLPEMSTETQGQAIKSILDHLCSHRTAELQHFNLAFKKYLEIGFEFSPSAALSELKSIGIEPNAVTFELFVRRYCNANDMESASLLYLMNNENFALSTDTLNAIVEGYVRTRDNEKVAFVLDILIEKQGTLGLRTFTALAIGYAAIGDLEKLEKAIAGAAAVSRNSAISVDDCLSVIKALAENGFEDYIERVMTHCCRRIGSEFRNQVLSCLLFFVCEHKYKAAFEIVRCLPSSKENNISFFLRSLAKFNLPLSNQTEQCKYLEEQGVHDALAIRLKYAFQQGDLDFALHLLKLLEQKNNINGVCKYLNWMRSASVEIETETVGLILKNSTTILLNDLKQGCPQVLDDDFSQAFAQSFGTFDYPSSNLATSDSSGSQFAHHQQPTSLVYYNSAASKLSVPSAQRPSQVAHLRSMPPVYSQTSKVPPQPSSFKAFQSTPLRASQTSEQNKSLSYDALMQNCSQSIAEGDLQKALQFYKRALSAAPSNLASTLKVVFNLAILLSKSNLVNTSELSCSGPNVLTTQSRCNSIEAASMSCSSNTDNTTLLQEPGVEVQSRVERLIAENQRENLFKFALSNCGCLGAEPFRSCMDFLMNQEQHSPALRLLLERFKAVGSADVALVRQVFTRLSAAGDLESMLQVKAAWPNNRFPHVLSLVIVEAAIKVGDESTAVAELSRAHATGVHVALEYIETFKKFLLFADALEACAYAFLEQAFVAGNTKFLPVVWTIYMVNGKYSRSNQLYTLFTFEIQRWLKENLERFLHSAESHNNEECLFKAISLLRLAKGGSVLVPTVYNRILETRMKKQDFDGAVTIAKTALANGVSLNTDTLRYLEAVYGSKIELPKLILEPLPVSNDPVYFNQDM